LLPGTAVPPAPDHPLVGSSEDGSSGAIVGPGRATTGAPAEWTIQILPAALGILAPARRPHRAGHAWLRPPFASGGVGFG
jgi:hypothetical protein